MKLLNICLAALPLMLAGGKAVSAQSAAVAAAPAATNLAKPVVTASLPADKSAKPATAAPVAVKPAPATNVAPAVGSAPTPAPTAVPMARPTNAPAIISATKAAPVTNAPARNIRFQFEGIPYMDVLERFAQMTGKPLVADTNILGTLTFNDPTPYTYGEALDMLNVMLSMKGMMLMESGHYLQLVPFKQITQMPLKIMRGTDQSGDVRMGEVVTVVLPVKNVDSKEIADAVTAMLSSAGSVAALSKGRGLIVTDKLGNIQRIRYLLTQIDSEATVDRQMKTYTLLHASGAIVSDLLNRTFGMATAPKRTQYNPTTKQLDVLPADPNEYITSVYDDASRTLVLFGPNERLSLAEELINRFEQKDGGAGDVRIYYPNSIKPDELAILLRQAVPGVAASGETAASAATKARLIPDVPQNRLIVSAPIPGQLDEIENLITKLDKGVVGAKNAPQVPLRSTTVQLTKVFRPRAAEATNIAQILTTALNRKLPNGQSATTASVSCEVGSQSVVVSGSPGDIQIATDIVTQLETGTSQPTPMQTKFIDLGTAAEAKRLMPVVEQLYRNQVTDGLMGQGAHAKIMADADSGRLIVTASEDHIAKIEALITQLRGDRTKPQERRLEIITLKGTRVDTILKSVTELIAERMAEKRFQDLPKPLVLPDSANNRLLVTATADQLKEIEQVVSTLDLAPEKTQREMSLIPVQSKSASELIALATQLMTQMGEDQTNPQLAPKLVPDSSGKQIIVLATTKDTVRLQALLKQLDSAASTAVARQFKGVELFSRTSTEFTPLVTQLYQEQLKGVMEPSGGPATLIADAKNNRIMVSGTEKEITRVEAIIRQLDPAESKAAKEETRVIRLKAALAQDLSGLVEKSLGSQSSKVKVLVDARSNSLVVSGEAGAVEAAAKIISELDTRSDSSPREMRIIELKQGDATTTFSMVNSLFAELMKDKRGPDYVVQSKIVPDATGNRLIATGPKEELTVIADVVERLDQSPEAAGGARVFKLLNADAMQVVGVVSNAMLKFDARNQPLRRVSISVERESNSIIVSGPRTDLKDAESIIQRLDNEGLEPGTGPGGAPGSSRARELKIMDVKSEDPDALAALATRVFAAQNAGRTITNLVSITPEPNGKRLIVLAPSSVLTQVETVITTLDSRPDAGVRELQNINLKNASATELLPVVQRVYTEQSLGKTGKPATIYPDGSGTRFTVYGTKEQTAQIRQIVETLESQQRAPRETKIFDLGKLAEAQRVLPLIQQLYRDQTAGSPQAGPADAQLVSDGKTGRLIVSARTNQMPQIEQIIFRLQVGSVTNQAPRETKSFEVGNAAEVQRLLPLLQQLYRDQWQDKLEVDPADAQIIGDPKTGRLVVTGKPEHVKAIEAILKQFNAAEPGKAKTADTRETRIFDLTTASAVELSSTVRTLYLDQAKSRLGTITPDTLIVPDVGGNRMIVVGDTEELDSIEGIIKKLDKVSAQSSSARIFKLKSADPAKVAEIMTTALVRYDAYGRPQKRCSVTVDAKSRMLIVTGDPKELQSVSVIIEQLDQSLGERPERKMKVVTLKQGRVSDIMAKARQLYNDQLTSKPELSTSEMLMLEDSDRNQLILAGTEPQLKLLDQIVTELQAAVVVTGPRETKMIQIGLAEEMTRLLPLVQQLYQERIKNLDASDAPDAQILTDPKNARFIVTARSNHLAVIEGLVKDLRAGNLDQPRDTRIFDLTTANAVEFSTTVRSLYLDTAKNRPAAQPQDTLILPDVSANRLIVTGASNELAIVEDIIKKLDKVSAQSGTVRVFKLKSADPAKVLEILSNALTSYDSYGRPRRRVGVTLDAKSRTIIVAGDPKELQSLQNAAMIIEQLDTALGQQAERKIKVISLKQAKVAEMSPKVRQLYNDQLSSQPDLSTTEVLILEDAPSNQLILAGSDAQLKLVEKIVTDLEEATTKLGVRETKMIDIGQVDEMQRLQPLVQQLYQDHWKNKAASDPADATILTDAKTARFIVTARSNHIAEIEAIVSSLRAGQTLVPRDTRIVDLTTANAVELAVTVKSLYQDQLKARTNPPPAEATIVPDAVANRLVLSGPTNELDVVEDIVKKLDKVGAQSASVRVFKLKQADPAKVLEILQTALVRYDSYGRPQKRISVSVDAKSRTLIATGDPKELQGVSVIIEQLDSIGAQAERKMKVLAVKSGKATELKTKVRAIYDDQVKAQPELGTTDVLMLEDATSNQLILAGTEVQLKLIENITTQLETSALVQEPRETKVYELTSTSAPELATTVKSLYQEAIKEHPVSPASQAMIMPDVNANRLIVNAGTNDLKLIDDIIQKIDKTETQSGRTRVFRLKQAEAEQVATILSTALVQVTPYGRQVPRVSVGTDTANNLLIVSGAPQDLQGAAMIIEQMDTILAKEPRQMRVMTLTNGLASEVATRVKSLYQDQLKGRPKTGGADAVVLGDDVANRLIVTANESHMKLIEEIVGKLQETGKGSARQTRVVTLQRNSATSVAAMLSQLFTREVASTDPTQRLGVSASGDDRLIVIDGAGEMLKKVEELVKNLDGEGVKGTVEVRTYDIADGKADELAQSLARLFAERSAAAPTRYGMPQNGGGLAPRFEADPKGNALMVAATKDQFEPITKLIEELKKTAAVASEIRTFVLKNGDPEQISTILEEMLTDEAGGQRAPNPYGGARRMRWRPGMGMVPQGEAKSVRVAPATSLNAVVVQGPPDKLALAEKIIQNLDKTDQDAQTVIQSVHLKKAHADSLAEAVAKNMAAKGTQSRMQRVTVTAVDGANNLLISGPNDAVQEVMKIVRELDVDSEDDEIEVRIYKLENGQAKEVSRVVQQLLQSVTRAQQRTPRSGKRLVMLTPTVSVDDRSNSLIVSATPSHFKVIEKMLAQLDKAESKSDRDVQFVWLKNAKADEVATKLKAVFTGKPEAERPVVEADEFGNSLTVIARRSEMPQIQDIISRLDETTKDTSIQVRMRTVESVPVEQMARMLQNIYPQMARGSLRIVEKLEPPKPKDTGKPKPSASGPTTNNAPAKGPDEAARTAPEVVIAVDKDANTLLLSGPANELDQIDRIMSDLALTFFGNEAELRLFSLKEADPVIVARTLNDLFRVEPVRVEQTVQRPGEVHTVRPQPKLTAVAEPRTRSVIVRAKPTDFALVESLLKQLDASGLNAQLEYRVVALTNAQPQKVLPLVQQMVTQMNIVRPGEPLTVSIDTRSRGILVVARDTVLNQVEKMIHSLDTVTQYEEAQVLVLTLKKASAPQLALVLQSMLRPAEQTQVTPEARELQEQVRKLKIQNDKGELVQLDLTKPIKIMADPVGAGAGGGNRLIITSTPDNLKALATVVTMMDSVPVLEGVEVKLAKLEHADAAMVSQTLNSIFAQGARLTTGRGGPGEPASPAGKALARPFNVAVDARSNTLILSGSLEALDLAMRVIDDLDKQVERFVTEVKLFRLKHASAIRLLPMLQAVFAEGPTVPGSEGLSTMVTRLRVSVEGAKPKTTEAPKARQALVMQADDLSNMLIVAARSDALPLIEDVINQLDIPAASGLETVRIYPLNHADATSMQRIITALYTGPKSATMRAEDKPNLTLDERSNSLIVSGNTKAFAVIDGLIAKLDQKLAVELRDIQILPLQHADAATVAGTLQRLMDARVTQKAALQKQTADSFKVVVMADERSNSLLIGGSKDSFELVESLAQQLDQAEPALSGRIRLIPLEYADARTLATSLTTLFTQRYAAARTPEMQRKRPIIVADPRGNALMVAAGQDDNQTLDELLKKLDQDLKDPSMQVVVLPLRHNDSAKVAATLEGIFTARQRVRSVPGQPPTPQDLVRVETDSLNNALVIYASKENQALAKGLLEKIDVEPDTIGGVVEVFVLEFADAQRVSGMLKTLVQQGLYRPGAPATAGGKSTSNREALAVTVDPRSNTLIVSASPENLLVVKEVIKRVDTKDFAAAGNMKLYSLKKARASSLATVLEQFFRAKRAGEAVAINAAERSVPVAVIPDDRSNILLVTGSKESFDAMDRLVEQLDGEDVFTRMNFQVFPLKKATAMKLQGTLRQIVANRPQRIKGEVPDPITIVADQWVNALLVGAAVDDLTLVTSLIEKLDTDAADLGIAVQVLPLAKADARRVATTVQALFREGATGTGSVLPVMVNADERMNALVVSAGEGDIRRIAELVKKLDTDQVSRISEIKIFPLRFARAESLSTILNTALNTKPVPLNEMSPNTQSLLQFITRTEHGQELVTAALKEAVLITPDARMNSLIVSGPVDYMGLLEQIINRLDTSSPQVAKIRVFTLQNADVHQMATVIMQLFRMQVAPGQNVASQRSIQYTLMKAASGEGEPGSEDDEELASATLGTAEQSALTVTVDPRTNSLLVGGTDHYVELVAKIIESLDACPARERKTELYRLRNAQAEDVALSISTFLNQERTRITQVLGAEAVGTTQRLLDREVAIVAEKVSNTLLISANPRFFDELKALVEELDQPLPQVLIQVLLAEVTLDSVNDLGIEWRTSGSMEGHSFEPGTDFGLDKPTASAPFGKTLDGGFSSVVTGDKLQFYVRALQNDGRLEVLSRPQILTSDNKAATINIGQRFPILDNLRVSGGGASEATTYSYRYENVGVTLTVTPRIRPDGVVRMEIGTTNSTMSSSASTAGLPGRPAVFNQRLAQTTVSVLSGQTVVIGGLISTTDDIRTKRVPLLGSLPVLGALFRSQTKSSERRELLIFLTPQVVLNVKDNTVRTSDYKAIDLKTMTDQETTNSTIKMGIKRDALQHQILDPIFPPPPTNAVDSGKSPKVPAKSSKSPTANPL